MHMHYKLDFQDKDNKTENEFRSRPQTKKCINLLIWKGFSLLEHI